MKQWEYEALQDARVIAAKLSVEIGKSVKSYYEL